MIGQNSRECIKYLNNEFSILSCLYMFIMFLILQYSFSYLYKFSLLGPDISQVFSGYDTYRCKNMNRNGKTPGSAFTQVVPGLLLPRGNPKVSLTVSRKRASGFRSLRTHCHVHSVLPVKAASCITSAPHTKLAVYNLGLIHFASSVISGTSDELEGKEK